MRRKMRIASSYLCLTLFIASAILWVYSYRVSTKAVLNNNSDGSWYMSSWEGRMTLIRTKYRSPNPSQTRLFITPAAEFRAQKSFAVKNSRGPLLNPASALDFASFEGVWADGIFKRMWGTHYPHWLSCILLACLASVLRPSPRFRFKLIEVFALVTIAAAVVGSISTILGRA